jgi:integrase
LYPYCIAKRKNPQKAIMRMAVLKHLKDFSGGAVSLGDVTETFGKGFRDYPEFRARGFLKTRLRFILINWRSGVNEAGREKKFSGNPLKNLKGIPEAESQREFLTLAELQRLGAIEGKDRDLKNAALFSALAGLRFSDIEKLTWGEIQHKSVSLLTGYGLLTRQSM